MTYFRGEIAILKPRSAVTKNALIYAVVEVLKPHTLVYRIEVLACLMFISFEEKLARSYFGLHVY